MTRYFMILAVLFAKTADAQNLDYEQLFKDFRQNIVVTDGGVEVLETPNEVAIWRRTDPDGSKNYVGIDRSAEGAAGCAMQLYAYAFAALEICRSDFTNAEALRISRAGEIYMRFAYENSYPALSSADVETRMLSWRADLSQSVKEITARGDQLCRSTRNEYREMFLGVSDAAAHVTSKPRFVVTNPCL